MAFVDEIRRGAVRMQTSVELEVAENRKRFARGEPTVSLEELCREAEKLDKVGQAAKQVHVLQERAG